MYSGFAGVSDYVVKNANCVVLIPKKGKADEE